MAEGVSIMTGATELSGWGRDELAKSFGQTLDTVTHDTQNRRQPIAKTIGLTVDKKVSIKDVAQRAGVSATTVSHVLNEVPGKRINPDTRVRVREAADELGYQPNGVARSLRLQRSQTLALVSDEIATTPHAGRIILGAQEAASRKGWLLMLVNSGGDAGVEAQEIQALKRRQVDGFIYATMYHREVDVPEALRGLPTVLLDARTDDSAYPSVVPDEVEGGRSATRLLVEAGHRRVAFARNVDDIPATRGRLEGYRQELEAGGLAYDDRLVVPASSDTIGGREAGHRLLGLDPRPTAIFCFNDRMAMGVYQVAAELGLRIPEDLSVVGFDDQELIADGLLPGLTTVALPHREMGAWAVDTLIGQIENDTTDQLRVRLRCPVVERASVAAPPAG
jgi:LacI family transcriptional regulator